MAGRAHEREAAAIDRLERAADGERRCLPRRRTGDCVTVEPHLVLQLLDPSDVPRVVDAFDLLARGR
jgi:hypothetical protein